MTMNAVFATLCVVSTHIVTTRKARSTVYVKMDIGEILIRNVYVSRKLLNGKIGDVIYSKF